MDESVSLIKTPFPTLPDGGNVEGGGCGRYVGESVRINLPSNFLCVAFSPLVWYVIQPTTK